MKKLLSVGVMVVCGVAAADRVLPVAEYRDRMAGAWLGQSIGVAYGWCAEFCRNGEEFVPDAKIKPWTPALINETFAQDDLYVEMTFLATLAEKGLDVSPREAGIDFANSRYRLWCANFNARNNLRRGIAPPASSHPKYHKTTDDIDYQIEADFSGILSPGMPASVLKLGEKFGRIMNYGDGLYAGEFIGALYAEAYFERDRIKVVEAGLRAIPAESGYAEMARDMLAWYRADPKCWQSAWTNAVEKYGRKGGPKQGRVSWYGIDCKINGAMVLLGYLWGDGDVQKTMHIAVKGGYDADCNASSAIGVLGTQLGAKGLGARYTGGLDRKAKWEFTDYDWAKLLEASESVTRKIVVAEGGEIKDMDGAECFVIRAKPAVPGPCESSSRPGSCGDEKYSDEERGRILLPPQEKQGT